MPTEAIDLDALDLDGLTFDALVQAHTDTAEDRIRARDMLAPLTWPEWAAWQAWAICGEEPRPGTPCAELAATARSKLLRAARSLDEHPRKCDRQVPTLSEGEVIDVLDDPDLRAAWLAVYVRGRPLEVVAADAGMTPARYDWDLLRPARKLIELCLPPASVGVAVANGQLNLTI